MNQYQPTDIERILRDFPNDPFSLTYGPDWVRRCRGCTTFQNDSYGASTPAKVIYWDWSVTFGRWGALVEWDNGARIFTYPYRAYVPWNWYEWDGHDCIMLGTTKEKPIPKQTWTGPFFIALERGDGGKVSVPYEKLRPASQEHLDALADKAQWLFPS